MFFCKGSRCISSWDMIDCLYIINYHWLWGLKSGPNKIKWGKIYLYAFSGHKIKFCLSQKFSNDKDGWFMNEFVSLLFLRWDENFLDNILEMLVKYEWIKETWDKNISIHQNLVGLLKKSAWLGVQYYNKTCLQLCAVAITLHWGWFRFAREKGGL